MHSFPIIIAFPCLLLYNIARNQQEVKDMKRAVPLFLALVLILAPLHSVLEDITQICRPALSVQMQNRNFPVSRITPKTDHTDYIFLNGNESHYISFSVLQNQISDKQIIRMLMSLFLFLLTAYAWSSEESSRLISQTRIPQIRKRIIRSIYFTHGL